MPEISGTFHKTHIAEGNTMFRPVIRKIAKVKSRNVAEKAHSHPLTTAGKISGMVTVRKVRAVVAPVTWAASSNSLCSCSSATGNRGGRVGHAPSYLFSARGLLEFAIREMCSVAADATRVVSE